jgi:hypothetical protein
MSFFGVTHIATALSASGAYFYCFLEAIYDGTILRTHSDEPKNKKNYLLVEVFMAIKWFEIK